MGYFCSKAIFATVILANLALSGCVSVRLDRQIGKQLPVEELHRFVGDWESIAEIKEGAVLNEESKVRKSEPSERWTVRLLKTGDLKVARIKWLQEDQKFAIEEWRVAATEFMGSQYLHIIASPFVDAPPTLFVRIRRIDDNRLEVQSTDIEHFIKLVEAKEIEGSISKADNSLTVKLVAASLEKWMMQHPDKIDKLFKTWTKGVTSNPEQTPVHMRTIFCRAREAEDEQKNFSRYLLELK